MAKKKAKTTQRKTKSKKEAPKKHDVPSNTAEDAKAIAEKIFANLKKPN
jgi:hypothetical protein